MLAGAIFVVASAVVMELIPSEQTQAAELPPEWQFVDPLLAEMKTTAIRACTREGALKVIPDPNGEGDLKAIRHEYDLLAIRYNNAIGELDRQGLGRPAGVPATAPAIEAMKRKACLDVEKMPEPDPDEDRDAKIEPGDFEYSGDRFLTLEELDAAAAAAGWPMEPGWWPEMRLIIQCETGSLDTMAHNANDPNGGSWGLAQLNGRQHFDAAGEDFEQRFDPVVNLRTALWLRTVRGHFGGSGGWKICAERYGIP
ncbi:MAG: hypothetical protein ACM3S1_08710 [Hyphomicrobiales bacterium]